MLEVSDFVFAQAFAIQTAWRYLLSRDALMFVCSPCVPEVGDDPISCAAAEPFGAGS